jgi:pilus assembly protein Flp/PilA
MKTFYNMLRDESGAAAAEYALILAIVGAAIALAAVNLGSAVSNAMENATNCINNPPTAGSGSGASCGAGGSA